MGLRDFRGGAAEQRVARRETSGRKVDNGLRVADAQRFCARFHRANLAVNDAWSRGFISGYLRRATAAAQMRNDFVVAVVTGK